MTIPSDPSELPALIALLQTQQQRLQFRRFTNDDALELGSWPSPGSGNWS